MIKPLWLIESTKSKYQQEELLKSAAADRFRNRADDIEITKLPAELSGYGGVRGRTQSGRSLNEIMRGLADEQHAMPIRSGGDLQKCSGRPVSQPVGRRSSLVQCGG